MSNLQKEFLLFLLLGVGIGFFLSVFFPQRIEGKTAKDWYSKYQAAQATSISGNQASQILSNGFKDLITCIDGAPRYQDYYGGRSFIVNDVSDVRQCITDEEDKLNSQEAQNDENRQNAQQDQLLEQQGQQILQNSQYGN